MTTFTHLFLGDGRVTLAIREVEGEISVGIAWCSPKDQFSRAMGRETALMPLDHSEVTKKGFGFNFTSKLKKGSSIIRIKDEAVAHFMLEAHLGSITVPSWARKNNEYKYVHNLSGKDYALSWEETSVIVRENTQAIYSF